MAHILPTLRLAALGTFVLSPGILTHINLDSTLSIGTVVLFSVIVLGLSAHVTALTTTYYGGYFTFAALSIATAVLSIVSLPAM